MWRMFERLRAWWSLRRLDAARRSSARWRAAARRSLADLAKMQKKLETVRAACRKQAGALEQKTQSMREEIERLTDEALRSLQESRTVVERYEQNDEALQARIEVLEKVHLEGVILAHRDLCKMHEANIAASSASQARSDLRAGRSAGE